jgi:hypothetical protein
VTCSCETLADLWAELRLPSSKRDRTKRAIRREIAKVQAQAIAEHLQDQADKLTRPHVSKR